MAEIEEYKGQVKDGLSAVLSGWTPEEISKLISNYDYLIRECFERKREVAKIVDAISSSATKLSL